MQKIIKKLSPEQPIEKRQVFASYHFCQIKNPLIQGFGNFVGEFNMDAYVGQADKFVVQLESHLKDLLSKQVGFEVQVKILFFR